jgi:hypothetical protein
MFRACGSMLSFVLVVCSAAVVPADASSSGEAPWDALNRQECYEECNFQWGRDIEACSRKKNPEKREQCYAEANNRYAQCRRDCDKKYPED